MSDNVLGYIDDVSRNDQDRARMNSYMMSDGYVNKIVNDYGDKKKEQCMRDMVGCIYKDALPDNDEIKARSYDDMDDFIDNHCPNGLYKYITDSGSCAIGDTAKECSKAVDEACAGMKKNLKECIKENAMPLSESDIDFAKDTANEEIGEKIDSIARRGSFKELSEAIHTNVADAVRSSVESAKAAKKANADFEKELKDDLTVTTKESVENRIALRRNLDKKTYNLFEAMYASKAGSIMQESVDDYNGELNNSERIMIEAVAEYTKHSVWKALKLGRYDINTTKGLINDYLGR